MFFNFLDARRILFYMTTLDSAKLNKKYKITKFLTLDEKLCRRILELGLTVGQTVKALAESSLKKVRLVEIRGYVVSIKTSILKSICVEEM